MLARNRWFIAAALVYALVGGLVGLAWLADPSLVPGNALRLHAHFMLVGFVGMMIFGVGLHMLPRFTGRSLYSERAADVQFVVTNVGLIAMGAGWLATSTPVVVGGGALLWTGFALFALNVVLTVRPWGRRG
ncbi:MAG: cbb3-type cytochrome c oxidase subunit I [Burkholderiales bacterium]|nr:cbb3-type cytochrome c oxidase subunit I [Burkholderiales bacterium]